MDIVDTDVVVVIEILLGLIVGLGVSVESLFTVVLVVLSSVVSIVGLVE